MHYSHQKYKVKEISCPNCGKPIEFVHQDPSSDIFIYCKGCITSKRESKQNLIPIENLIDQAHNTLSRFCQSRLYIEIPEESVSFIKREQDLVKEVAVHISRQKFQVNHEFNNVASKIVKTIKEERDKILNELEWQFAVFKRTFADLSRKYTKYSNPYNEPTAPTKEELYSEINKATNALEMKVELKNMLLQARQSLIYLNRKGSKLETLVLEDIQQQQQHLENIIENLPFCHAGRPSLFESELEQLNLSLDQLQTRMKVMDNYIDFHNCASLKVDSQIITAKAGLKIQNIITDSKDFTMDLVYRASKKGFDLQNILDTYSKTQNAVILIKTDQSQTIGAYRDKPHLAKFAHMSERQVSFNLTTNFKQERITSPQPRIKASSQSSSFKPLSNWINEYIFLSDNIEKNNSCCHRINTPTQGKRKSAIIPSSYFGVIELEIFKVDFKDKQDFSILDQEEETFITSSPKSPMSTKNFSYTGHPVRMELRKVRPSNADEYLDDDDVDINAEEGTPGLSTSGFKPNSRNSNDINNRKKVSNGSHESSGNNLNYSIGYGSIKLDDEEDVRQIITDSSPLRINHHTSSHNNSKSLHSISQPKRLSLFEVQD